MSGERDRVRDIFERARRLHATERGAFLDGLAVVDGPMRARIDDMLAAVDEVSQSMRNRLRGTQTPRRRPTRRPL